MNDSSDKLAQLKLLSYFSERISHSIRTPAGIALGVLEDQLSGYTLSARDYEDAANAIRSIVVMLDSLRDFIGGSASRPEAVACEPFFQNQLQDRFGVKNGPELRVECAVSGTAMLIPELFVRAVRSTLRFLAALEKQSTSIVELTISNRKSPKLKLSFLVLNPSAREIKSAMSWSDFVASDHSLPALELIFAEIVFGLHGGKTSVQQSPGGGLQLEVAL